jgi:2-phospho-L-lactate guanylyltransferase
MIKKFLIAIPVRDFINPMSRLDNILTTSNRIKLSKAMLLNIVQSFQDENIEIVCVTRDKLVKEFCVKNNIKIFSSKRTGMNNELEDILDSIEYDHWTICHADLPYINKFFAKEWIKSCKVSDIVICSSKDNGTPLLGGSTKVHNLYYGKNSFEKHIKMFQEKNLDIKKSFNKEFSFEIDDEDDFIEFQKNTPRWFKGVNI